MDFVRAQGSTAEQVRGLFAAGRPLWLDIDASVPAEHAVLRDVFGFHPLAVEDTLNLHTRVKVEPYDGYLFVVVRTMHLDGDVRAPGRRLDVSKLCLFLGERYVVSVHARRSEAVETALRSAQNSGLLRQDDCGRIAHAICDAAIDAYFPILDRIDAYVDELERNSVSALDTPTFAEVIHIRRLAFAAHRSLAPQRAIFDELAHRSSPYLTAETQRYFRDVFDHSERICDSLDAYREIMAMTTESSVAHLSARLEYATTIFSAVATIALPFVIISGLFGMNFVHTPLAYNTNGFWIVTAAEIAISLALFTLLRRRHLL